MGEIYKNSIENTKPPESTVISIAKQAESGNLTKTSNLISRCVSDIQERPIKWLWDSIIPLGKLSIIAGNPGLGKSQITASIAAMASVGSGWPGGKGLSIQSNVAFMSAEDSAEDTIKPRLIAAGANLTKIHVIEGICVKQEKRDCINLGNNLSDINHYLIENPEIRLLIIDPVASYFGKIDSHRDSDVRGLFYPLSKLAQKLNIAILCVSHLNKSTANPAIERVNGSIGIVASVRTAFVAIKDPNNEERRLFLPIKNNLALDRNGFAFMIESVEIENKIKTSRIKWGESVTAHADDFLSQNKITRSSKKEDALEFLKTLLSGGPVETKRVLQLGNSAGFSNSTLERAKNILNIISIKSGLHSGWFWQLSQEPQNKVEDLR